jgi:hypothetical protein
LEVWGFKILEILIFVWWLPGLGDTTWILIKFRGKLWILSIIYLRIFYGLNLIPAPPFGRVSSGQLRLLRWDIRGNWGMETKSYFGVMSGLVLGSCSFAILYWDLYNIVNEPQLIVSQAWDGENLNFSFRRTVSQELYLRWCELLELMSTISLSPKRKICQSGSCISLANIVRALFMLSLITEE